VNAWLRDGAPLSSSTGLPVAVGSVVATTNRTIFYVAGVAQVNPTSGVATASGPGVHPAAGLFELANTVESAQKSGLWKVDPGTVSVNDGVMTTGSGVLTSATGSFTSAMLNHTAAVFGGGTAGAILNTFVASFQSANQVTLQATAVTPVSGAMTNIDGSVRGGTGISAGDGTHPGVLGHAMLGVTGAQMVATWQ
jgi:hypothetical protein